MQVSGEFLRILEYQKGVALFDLAVRKQYRVVDH